jgi:DNA-directed RNA polymerase specialized sigma24 family protein
MHTGRGRSRWIELGAAVEGLVPALERSLGGDQQRLECWYREGMPALFDALRRSGFGAAEADEAAADVLVQAWRAVAADARIADEFAWIATVAVNARRASRREARRHTRLDERTADELAAPCERADDAEDAAARIRRAIEALPPPYSHVIALRARHGLHQSQITRAIRRWRAVSLHRARKIQRAAFAMLRVALEGGSPRDVWPQRFGRKNPWIGTPLPLVATLLR